MKLKFELEIDVPEASEYAKLVHDHIVQNDYLEESDLGYQLCGDIIEKLENDWEKIINKQIPKDYYKNYNKALLSHYDNKN